ncbi:phage antirepressor KilAC domain-containing protein [Peribacillus loiseleuriae]|uniref:Antirepressor protein C-terminal domain-containing protein n=1 Tax=Peribacillus loiseleuriae TaxID=1679170 RepID=A0A0K9GSE2_9BACI|nr:phage antirepressor KilAC domain-containing protein [Peribacillus loiseleuriae]KMY49202.1 hypothetical protein AC625_06430 [Peribacillus loiseleuriae]
MNQLQIISDNGQLLVDSREVAEMVGREHKEILAMIEGQKHKDGRVKHIGFLPTISESGLFPPSEFFIESSFKVSGNNKSYKCYLLTRKGCDMVANKMTGEKGVLFTASYVTQFEKMEQELKERSFQLPTTYKEALLQLVEQVEAREQLEVKTLMLEQQVAEYEPKITYLDTILNSADSVTISQIAEDYGMSAQKFNKLLHENGIQHKINGQWLLYTKHKGEGYTKSKTADVTRKDGTKKIVMNTQWTQKGRLFIYETLKNKGIYPMMDIEVDRKLRLVGL